MDKVIIHITFENRTKYSEHLYTNLIYNTTQHYLTIILNGQDCI